MWSHRVRLGVAVAVEPDGSRWPAGSWRVSFCHMGAAPNGVTPRRCGRGAGAASRGCGRGRAGPAGRPGPAASRLAGIPAHRGGHGARPRRVPGVVPGARQHDRPRVVLDALDQLAGAFVPASALETVVLPGRVPRLLPRHAGRADHGGEVVWTGAGGLPGGDGWLVLAPAEAASLLFPEPSEITMTPLHEAILTVLADGGAVFFRMLHERVTATSRRRPGSRRPRPTPTSPRRSRICCGQAC